MRLSLGSSARVKMGFILVSLSALLSAVGWLDEAARFDPKSIGRDNVTLYEKWFQDLKKMLPSKGVVGYLTDDKAAGKQDPDEIRASERFILTQYALAPLIVLDTPNCRLVVGSFHGANFVSSIAARKNFKVLLDYSLLDNRGVILLYNRDVR